MRLEEKENAGYKALDRNEEVAVVGAVQRRHTEAPEAVEYARD